MRVIMRMLRLITVELGEDREGMGIVGVKGVIIREDHITQCFLSLLFDTHATSQLLKFKQHTIGQ